ncbi:MAG TPA: hypothetical protein VK020_10845 [Microlunatus sp.]|nr:hypothetical protein [Microlunatus sp.]
MAGTSLQHVQQYLGTVGGIGRSTRAKAAAAARTVQQTITGEVEKAVARVGLVSGETLAELRAELAETRSDLAELRRDLTAARAELAELRGGADLANGDAAAPAKKAPAGKSTARRTPAKKAPAGKSTARKTSAKKAPAKKATAKKAAAKPAPDRKPTAKQTNPEADGAAD